MDAMVCCFASCFVILYGIVGLRSRLGINRGVAPPSPASLRLGERRGKKNLSILSAAILFKISQHGLDPAVGTRLARTTLSLSLKDQRFCKAVLYQFDKSLA